MKKEAKRYWFSAKNYGWGWGLPAAWQGWAVLVVSLIGFSAIPFIASPVDDLLIFTILNLFLAAALICICFVKGEPVRWRWGAPNK